MDHPKISIVTPVFNGVTFLEQTILSVIEQKYQNLEYIIIDGGSLDGTVDIIKKYREYVTYWISEPDLGMYDALNKGFQKSTGEIMAWLNSDDIYHKGALYNVADIFISIPDTDWIIGNPSLFNSAGLCVKMFDLQKWSSSRIYTGDFRWIQQENIFWRRSLWEKSGAGLNSSYKLAGDFDLWTRFFKNSVLNSVQTSFGGFRLHGQQLSINQLKQYEAEVSEIIEKNKQKNLRTITGKTLYSIVKGMESNKNIFVLLLKTSLQLILNKFNKYPPVIFYNFDAARWEK